jgi:hypothetical protein
MGGAVSERHIPRHQRIALAMRGYTPGDYDRAQEFRREAQRRRERALAVFAPFVAEQEVVAERIRAAFAALWPGLR